MGSYPPQGSGSKARSLYKSNIKNNLTSGLTTFFPITFDGGFYSVDEGDLGIRFGRSGTVIRIAGFINFGNNLNGTCTVTLRKNETDTGTSFQWPASTDDYRESTTKESFTATDAITLEIVTLGSSGDIGLPTFLSEIEWD